MDQTRDATIDFIRVVASILVITIHTTSWNIAMTVGRWAVPFFMVVTGYFYFLKPNHDRLLNIIHSLLRLWILWMIIYIPIGLHALVGLKIKKIIFKLIWSVIGYSVCYVGSWYLPAAAFGLWVVDYLNRKGYSMIRNVLAIFSLFLGCISSNYSKFHLGMFSSIHWCTSIIIGILWMTLSYYIANYNKVIKDRFHSIWWLAFAVGLTVLERIIILKLNLLTDPDQTDVYFTLPISVFIVFGFILGHPWKIKKRQSLLFRNFATLLFFTQFAFVPFNMGSQTVHFTITLVGSTVISLIILILSNIKHLKWISYLYE